MERLFEVVVEEEDRSLGVVARLVAVVVVAAALKGGSGEVGRTELMLMEAEKTKKISIKKNSSKTSSKLPAHTFRPLPGRHTGEGRIQRGSASSTGNSSRRRSGQTCIHPRSSCPTTTAHRAHLPRGGLPRLPGLRLRGGHLQRRPLRHQDLLRDGPVRHWITYARRALQRLRGQRKDQRRGLVDVRPKIRVRRQEVPEKGEHLRGESFLSIIRNRKLGVLNGERRFAKGQGEKAEPVEEATEGPDVRLGGDGLSRVDIDHLRGAVGKGGVALDLLLDGQRRHAV